MGTVSVIEPTKRVVAVRRIGTIERKHKGRLGALSIIHYMR
jgi:hypothetical protein